MAKKQLPASFNEVVCERLRSLAAWRNKAITEKKGAEEERDRLDDEINSEKEGDNKTRLEKLKAAYCDAIHEIDRWRKIRKAAESKLVVTIQKGDQGELFEVAKVTEKSLFDADDDEDLDDDKDEAEAGELAGDAA